MLVYLRCLLLVREGKSLETRTEYGHSASAFLGLRCHSLHHYSTIINHLLFCCLCTASVMRCKYYTPNNTHHAKRNLSTWNPCAKTKSSDILGDALNSAEVERRTDQRQMTERLRRVPQLLPAARDLLRKHAQVIREAEHVLEQTDGLDPVPRLVDAGPDHGLDEPEGAHAEGPFSATYTYDAGTKLRQLSLFFPI